ncbi:addiction module toxin, RelE/StbE family [Cylindrospermum stagnale PCC 7417]|uniref:Addiction module toxin, RelE/StbE family n=1 Tax=Cylindrospermum stagnale PCC 7417 TaxID=56107 RepID=K9X0S0_9NOST|nr:type II toxin-antitoxin system RelE/ParE family toxin [Cylindrospermum stagnale]AFZ25372.1 addiction module toxin, RelE/StbE family [Cylindrospermum stagnale PCC 7417]
MYSVKLSPDAEEFYAGVDKSLAKKIARCFEILEKEPRNYPNIKPLRGELSGYYRYRVGDYRVIYEIDDELNQVTIIFIEHRSRVYD